MKDDFLAYEALKTVLYISKILAVSKNPLHAAIASDMTQLIQKHTKILLQQ